MIKGIGKFHHLLLLTCGLCLMTTITETLNIGFAVPLIESEGSIHGSIRLSLFQKGVLDSAAFMDNLKISFKKSKFLKNFNPQASSSHQFSGDSSLTSVTEDVKKSCI